MNMNKYIKNRGTLFFTGILFVIMLLIYIFAATHFTSDTNLTENKSYGGAAAAGLKPTLPAENDPSYDNETSADNPADNNEKRGALIGRESDGLYAASRGDTERYRQAAPAATNTDVDSAPAAKETPAPSNAVSNASAAAKPAAESEDLDLLARLITAEAQGEPFDAQVAVGAVVMNRVKSSDWPNSIKDVIYQKIGEYYQFTPVVNGWINKPAQPEAIEAAKAAMNGSDPTNGAQFYYDDKCTNEWILAKPVALRVGHMIFAY